jgi:hypothetical protein
MLTRPLGCSMQRNTPRVPMALSTHGGAPRRWVQPAVGDLEAVARRAGAFEMTEIPQWRCLIVRTWLEDGEPDYEVVADGHWLIYDMSFRMLIELTGQAFTDEFAPAAS